MANLKDLLNHEKYNQVRFVLELAGRIGEKNGTEVYVVGGFVRDLIMGKPLNDIDIMTVGEGISFAKKLAESLDVKNVIPFKKFGTALIPFKKIQIEVATARYEEYKEESRKPSKIIF